MALQEKLHEVEKEKEQVVGERTSLLEMNTALSAQMSDSLANINELQCREVELGREVALLRGFMEASLQEDEAKRIMRSRTEGTVRSKKKEQVEDTKQIVQVIQIVQVVQVVQVVQIIQIALEVAQAVGNLKETEYDIRFNPNVFCPGVLHPKNQGQLKKEYQIAQDAQSKYLDLFQKAGNQLKILPHKVDSLKVEDMEPYK